MASNIKNFLLVFDRAQNTLLHCHDYGSDINRATQAYGEMEKHYRHSHTIDAVLVGSHSLETIKITHSTYFVDGAKNLIERALSPHLTH